MNVGDKTIIKTIDNQLEKLTKSIQEGQPMHMRDKRVEPEDGYENYVTIVEAQVTDAMLFEKKAAVNSLTSLKQYLLSEEQ